MLTALGGGVASVDCISTSTAANENENAIVPIAPDTPQNLSPTLAWRPDALARLLPTCESDSTSAMVQ
eukprot:362265-Chlamydomonas_euryale.AAC.4